MLFCWFLSSGSVWRATNEDLALMRTCVVMCGFILSSELVEFRHSKKDSGRQLFDKTDALDDIVFPPVVIAQWEDQSKNLLLICHVHLACVKCFHSVRGMMYYRWALEFEAFLDMAKESVGVNGSELSLHSFTVGWNDVRFLIMDYTGQVQSFKFIPLVYQIASRLGDPKDGQAAQSFQFALVSLLKTMAIDHPYHTVFSF
ncbi:hypothetical protein POM88_049611 [Heracleum sosnowskyi]|uniref:Uncharacterized protein n=1 Tax=Heracleum sosnowskyi TaxID=360622 RepID=A0AAD8LZN0_9APIA|nr:hypothetical protein POM88_049611 [Heracleum sosnowskyi]